MAHMLEKALGADTEKYLFMTAGPSITIVALYIIIKTLIDKSMEEANPPKK